MKSLTAAKSTYGSLAKTANVTENAQKLTETNEKNEDKQTPAETESGAENGAKMSVVARERRRQIIVSSSRQKIC